MEALIILVFTVFLLLAIDKIRSARKAEIEAAPDYPEMQDDPLPEDWEEP